MALQEFPDFRSAHEASFFERFQRVGLNTARYIDRDVDYGYDLIGLFRGSDLEPLLTTPGAYNATFIRLFYCNLVPSSDVPVARSYVNGVEVEFTVDHLAAILGVPGNGEPDLWSPVQDEDGVGWAAVNMELSGVPGQTMHDQDARRLSRDPYLIQFILRHCLFIKAGDKIHINSTLALATYFCRRRQRFNVALALMRSILALTEARTKRQPANFAYGHIIQYVIQRLYGIAPVQGNDTRVVALQRKSVTLILKLFRGDGARRHDGAEEDDQEEAAPRQRRAPRAESGGSGGGRGRQGEASPQRSANSAARVSHMEAGVRQMGASGLFDAEDMRVFASELRRIRRAQEQSALSQERTERHLGALEQRFAAYHRAWCAHSGAPDPDVVPESPPGDDD